MKADIEWTEKLENRVKRKVRITFPGKTLMKWQTKRSDEETWDYDTPPTLEDWDNIVEKVDVLYHRRRLPYHRLELVKKLRDKARGE
ncbi:hypothetical protein EGM51_00655 [Verrucomicrobia bacterium S94]|nr:hypothetical protein EGM51_00655 [Verrucomicrobia bacterium S94]